MPTSALQVHAVLPKRGIVQGKERHKVMRRHSNALGWGVMLLAGLVLAGCATGSTQSVQQAAAPQAAQTSQTVIRDPEERLRVRAAQYWDARVRGDLVETYQLHEPAFRRAVSLTAFAQGRGTTTVLEYAILGQEIQSDQGVVRVKIRSTFRHPKLVKPVEPKWHEFEERWVLAEGDWYRRFRFPVGDPYPAVNWDALGPGREQPRSPAGR